MSIVNVLVEKSRVILSTDTANYHKGEVDPAGFSTKTLALPHIRAAVAFRGASLVFLNALIVMNHTCADTHSVDDLVTQLPAIIGNAVEFRRAWGETTGDTDPYFDACEFTIAGWSVSRKRAVCIHARYSPDTGSKFFLLPEGFHMGPNLRDPDFAGAHHFDPKQVRTPKTFIEAAEKQRVLARETATACVGGELMTTTVTERGVEQDIVYRWPDKVGHADGVGSPVPSADEVRAFFARVA